MTVKHFKNFQKFHMYAAISLITSTSMAVSFQKACDQSFTLWGSILPNVKKKKKQNKTKKIKDNLKVTEPLSNLGVKLSNVSTQYQYIVNQGGTAQQFL